jgi:rhodanese-related sulfurtransferase
VTAQPRIRRPSPGPPTHLLALALAVVALLALAACCTSGVASAGPVASAAARLPAEISVIEAVARHGDGAFVLDVREPSEWAEGHIEGATLIPLGELAGRLAEVPRDRDVVVVCRSGNRSAQGRDILRDAGYVNVTSMAGGITDWIAEGRPIVTGP